MFIKPYKDLEKEEKPQKNGFSYPCHYKQILTTIHFTNQPFQLVFLNNITNSSYLTVKKFQTILK